MTTAVGASVTGETVRLLSHPIPTDYLPVSALRVPEVVPSVAVPIPAAGPVPPRRVELPIPKSKE